MHPYSIDAAQPKPALYAQLVRELAALIEGERDVIANLANAAALLYHSLPDLNWAGFYLLKEGELVVGPFQGKPACVRIALGKGVCGTAASRRETVIVRDVHEFPGHIACDAASNSEIVVPMINMSPSRVTPLDGRAERASAAFGQGDGELLGVLDLDSPKLARFDAEDRQGLERFVTTLLATG